MIPGLQEWVSTRFDVLNERQTSRGFQAFLVCPYCGKEKEHFAINLETGVYACYICGDGHGDKKAGSYVNMVLDFETLNVPSRAAFNSQGQYYYAKKKVVDQFLHSYISDISMEDLERIYGDKEETAVESREPALKLVGAVPGAVELDSDGVFPRLAVSYLKTRGITKTQAKRLGFAVGTSGKYMGYILIPIIEQNKIISFVARACLAGRSLRYTGPSLQEGWTPKSELLYGIDRVKPNQPCVLVEGIFDALAIWDLTSVALLGKIITTEQTRKLIKRKPSRVTVLLDGGFETEAREVASYFVGFVPDIRIARMDVADVDPSDAPELAAKAILTARSLFE